jgi:hypothetical protein
VLVASGGVEHDDQLNDWIRRAEEFVVTLPGAFRNDRKITSGFEEN